IIRGRLYRGAAGEYHAAFAYGTDWVFLKAPDAKVTVPGTDLVGLNLRTGEILIIDNKSVRARVSERISALEKNFTKNLADDVAALNARLHPADDPRIAAGVQNLEQALADIEAYFKASGITDARYNEAPVQRRIAALLGRRNIRRAATG